jgi:hypothetical protein
MSQSGRLFPSRGDIVRSIHIYAYCHHILPLPLVLSLCLVVVPEPPTIVTLPLLLDGHIKASVSCAADSSSLAQLNLTSSYLSSYLFVSFMFLSQGFLQKPILYYKFPKLCVHITLLHRINVLSVYALKVLS